MHGCSAQGVFSLPPSSSSSSLHLMGLILPLHFAALNWQGSQSSQHLLLNAPDRGVICSHICFLSNYTTAGCGLPSNSSRDADGHLFD